MFIEIAQVVLILALFIPIRWFTWKITEVWGLPEWLDYKPFNCKLCLTFWSLLAAYLSIGLIFQAYITLIGGIVLAILNAIAMWIDQRNKTIKI
jgi:hypothetical protein